MKKPKLPTDLELMEEIYKRYYDDYSAYTDEIPTRRTKVFVQINIQSLSDHYNIDADIIFGRLYYHMNDKYSYVSNDGKRGNFFVLAIGDDRHLIQFPLLSSRIAELHEERRKFFLTFWLSIVAIAISIVSIIVSVFI